MHAEAIAQLASESDHDNSSVQSESFIEDFDQSEMDKRTVGSKSGEDKPFLVIRNTFPKSSISQIMSNYFRKFVNTYAAHNDAKVYVTSNEEIDECLSASGKMERGSKFHSDTRRFSVSSYSSNDHPDFVLRSTADNEASNRVPKLVIPAPSHPPPENLRLPTKSRQFTALIVDDSLVHRKILTKLFLSHGFAVAELSDGLEVVEVIQRVMQTLPFYQNQFVDISSQERSKSVKAMHENIERNVSMAASSGDSLHLSSRSSAASRDSSASPLLRGTRRSLSSTSPNGIASPSVAMAGSGMGTASSAEGGFSSSGNGGSGASTHSSSNSSSHGSASTASSREGVSPNGQRRLSASGDHISNYYANTCDPNSTPSSSCTTARATPRLLQFALTNHTKPSGSGKHTSKDPSLVSLEDTVVDSLAPQIMLKIRKENIDLGEFIENREQIIHNIDNEQFNEAYFQQQTLGSQSGEEGHETCSSIVYHPQVGVVGRQKSIVREMTMNSPRVMSNILTHLSALHPPHGEHSLASVSRSESVGGVGETTSLPSWKVESFDVNETPSNAEATLSTPSGGCRSMSTTSTDAGDKSFGSRSTRITNSILSSFNMKNTMTHQSHVYADSMVSAMNITQTFNTITHDNWQQIDVIIMDFVMVNMNGPEAVQHIRAMGFNGLIIGLTAKALSNDINIFLIHGVDAVFSKPLNWDLFMETFEILHRQTNIINQGQKTMRE